MSGQDDEPAQRRTPPSDALTVVDLFCGPGGLSEGFHQAGFRTVLALDYDRAAVETYKANNPGVETIQADIRDISWRDIPTCDVLIGGPPCTTFSSSNRGGNGNVLEGLELVQAFLRIVYFKNPRWWVMENVPRITKFLPPEVPLRWIGIDSDDFLAVPQRNVFNAADFGVPQTRKRFLMGNYPTPSPSHQADPEPDLFTDSCGSALPAWKTLAETLAHLPSPQSRQSVIGATVSDPTYDLTIPLDQLTDQFMDTTIPSDELGRLRRAKEEHPFMGRMSFPDDVNRPARTVVATQLGRETLVLPNPDGVSFRRLTVREVACLQSFPVTYQFFGGLTARYRLVGDAVPPRLSYNIALEILREAGLPLPSGPHVESCVHTTPPPILTINKSARRSHKPSRRFSRMVPGKELRGCRAELSNVIDSDSQECIAWRGVLHVGEGRQRQELTISPRQALRALRAFCIDDDAFTLGLSGVMRDLDDVLATVPTGRELQQAWIQGDGTPGGPDLFVEGMATVIDEFAPRQRYLSFRRNPSDVLPILRSNGIPLRLVLGLCGAAQTAQLANALTEDRPDVPTLYDTWLSLASEASIDLRERSSVGTLGDSEH